MTDQQRAATIAKKASDQHGRIREALVDLAVAVERCTTSRAPASTVGTVIAALDSVSLHVERHFDAEEAMRLHEHLGFLVPEHAGELRALVLDHSKLRGMLRGCRRLVSSDGSEKFDELRFQVERFLRRLHAHEDAEDRLMRQALATPAPR